MNFFGELDCAKRCPYKRTDPVFPCGIGIALGNEAGMSQCDSTAEKLEAELRKLSGVTAIKHTAGQEFARFYISKKPNPDYVGVRDWETAFVVADGKRINPREFFQ